MFFVLIFDLVKVHIALLGALGILLLIGVLTPLEVVSGFANQSVLTVAALFIVIGAIQETNFIKYLAKAILKEGKGNSWLTIKLMTIIAGLSAFLNNIPLVLLFTPIVKKWGIINHFSPSKLLIPLSYAAILGGMCTLIGTSTNLIVHALLKQNGYDGFGMFELAVVGVPSVVGGILYMGLYGHKHLPELTIRQSKGIDLKNIDQDHKRSKAWDGIAYVLFIIMIIVVSFQLISMLTGAMIVSIIFLFARIISLKEAIRSIPWQLLIVIGSALGLAEGLEKSGAAFFITEKMIAPISHFGPYALLIAIYFVTSIATEMITNNAAAVFVFPIALFMTEQMSLNLEPFAVAIAIAASASFATPIGYQTNLIVYEAGYYKFKHFIITGIPMKIIVMSISILLIPVFWPLT
ncbi:SLC13 family permease [Pseudalkalibacillus hwajinpoensis]|uniref:SLC13 family permease n=1 Tax=Guptibacillus hwajinpoensis TaxID=208199 RepID=UPI00325BECF0